MVHHSSSSNISNNGTTTELVDASEGTSLLGDGATTSTTENDKEAIDDDAAAATTSIKSYIRLFSFFVASIIAGGIIPGQNEYNRLFCESGVFRYACSSSSMELDDDELQLQPDETEFTSACCPAQWLLIANVMNTLSLVVVTLFLLFGLLFDIIGGQYASILGCSMLCVGIGILACLVHVLQFDNVNMIISPLMETSTFILGVILCDVGSFLVNVGFYGFLWHLPKQQALVLSLSNSCLSCASFLPLVLSAFMTWSGYNLSSSLGLYAGVVLVFSGSVCYRTVPSIEEYRSQALKVLGLPIPRRSVKGLKGAIAQLREGISVLTEVTHAKFHKLTIAVSVFAFIPSFVYMSMGDPLGKEIFGEGNGLGVLFLKINTTIGLFVGPLVGIVVDHAHHPSDGLVEIGVLISICFAIVTPLVGVASWTIQTIVLVCICASQTMFFLYVTRYAVVFAYPNRVGTVSGLLISLLGILTLPLVLLVSWAIAFVGYIKPSIAVTSIGAVAWIVYVIYLKRNKPFPTRPVLLPKDELEIAKHFSVATIEDAAYVANMTPDELLELSSSTKVESMRRLSKTAMSDEAGKRLLKMARRRSSVSVEATYSALDYPFPSFAEGKVVNGTLESSFNCVSIAFNGHGGFGGRNEPFIEWIFSSLGPPDDQRRIDAIHIMFRPMLAVAETYGIIFEVKDTDPFTGNLVTAAVCACYPPGDLEDDGSPMKIGSDRYFYGYSTANTTMSFEDKPGEFKQKMACFKQDTQWDEKRKDYGDMWYVAVLGTHPVFQGRGYGRLLLDIVSSFADKTHHDCYLECSAANVAFYEKNGYKMVWKNDLSVDGDSIAFCGMAKRYQKK